MQDSPDRQEAHAQMPLKRLITVEEYHQDYSKRQNDNEEAGSSERIVDSLSAENGLFSRAKRSWHEYKKGKKEKSVNWYDRYIQDNVREMFARSDPSEATGFYNEVINNAQSLGNTKLVEEIERMRERTVDQAFEEYSGDTYSKEARMIEKIALFVSNRFEEPLMIKIDPERDAIYYNQVSSMMWGKDAYAESLTDKDEVYDQIVNIYKLIGLGEFASRIPPDFTKQKGFMDPPDISQTFISYAFKDPTSFTFRFIRPTTKTIMGGDYEKRYFPARVGLQLNKERNDWPQVAKLPQKQSVEIVDWHPKLLPVPI